MLSLVEHAATGDPAAACAGEWRMSDHEGRWHFTETVVANLLDDPHVRSLVFTSRDVGERVRFQNELEHQAFHDALTGLANRVLFKERVEHSLARAVATRKVAVLFMDIDDFKLVNDSYGHVLGDSLLVQVADRLRAILRSGDTAARLGGDEFAILLEGVADPARPADVAERALACSTTTSGSTRPSSRRRSASASPCPTARTPRPRSCSATPTWPCTRPRPTARTASRSSSPRCRRPSRARRDGQRAASGRRRRGVHRALPAHRRHRHTSASWARRPSSAGTAPARASCSRAGSSRSPRRPA